MIAMDYIVHLLWFKSYGVLDFILGVYVNLSFSINVKAFEVISHWYGLTVLALTSYNHFVHLLWFKSCGVCSSFGFKSLEVCQVECKVTDPFSNSHPGF